MGLRYHAIRTLKEHMKTLKEDKEENFRSETNGVRLLRGLFLETSVDPDTVLYSLKPFNGDYPSLYLHYMNADDLTEYRFADRYLENWEHWLILTECNWFKHHVERWREDLQARATSRAVDTIRQDAHDPESPSRVASAKYIAEEKWRGKTTPTKKAKPVGRPKKETLEGNDRPLTPNEEASLLKDAERILN